MIDRRLSDLRDLYGLLARLETTVQGARQLAACTGRLHGQGAASTSSWSPASDARTLGSGHALFE
jgi:hypothetical protein